MRRRLPAVPRRVAGLALAVALGSGIANSPAGATGARAPAPKRCPQPPVTVRIQPGPVGTTATTAGGAAEFRVTDAVARRVPIVPVTAGGTARDATELRRLERKAARTRLALYSLYLADFPVPRESLSGFGFGDVTPPTGKTVATLTVVPTRKQGFRPGDVVGAGSLGYDTTTTFAPVSLIVTTSAPRASTSYDAVSGQVTIRELTAKAICLDMAVTFTRNGTPVSSATGVVRAPVVKADPRFFFT